jgi:hypothetical protein
MFQNCGHQLICEHRGPLWWWWWCRLGITPDSYTRALRQSYQPRHLGQVGGMDEGVRILSISIWNTLRILSHAVKCRKILRHGTSSFTSHPKEGLLRIFISLKNPSPRPGLNPRPLDPVASRLLLPSIQEKNWRCYLSSVNGTYPRPKTTVFNQEHTIWIWAG